MNLDKIQIILKFVVNMGYNNILSIFYDNLKSNIMFYYKI